MEIFFADQGKILLESCILGLIFGVGYDIIRVFHVLCGIGSYKRPHRGILPPPPEKGRRTAFLLYLAGDVAYMALFTFFVSVFLFHANHGQVRLFLIAGGLAGFLMYRWTIGRLVMAVSEEIVCALKRLWQLLVWQPIRWLARLLWRLLRSTGVAMARFCLWLWRLGPGRGLAALCRWMRRQVCRRRLEKCIKRLPDTMGL